MGKAKNTIQLNSLNWYKDIGTCREQFHPKKAKLWHTHCMSADIFGLIF